MNIAKRGFLTLLVLCLCGTAVFAQTSSLAEKADKLFQEKQYMAALEQYQNAYKSVSSNKVEKNRIYFQIGECYRLTNNYKPATAIYRRLISSKYYTSEPKVYFYLAEMYRFEGKFDEAEEQYANYLQLVPDDKFAVSRKESIFYVSQLISNRTRHTVRRVADWNSEYNDWSPRFVGEDTTQIVFTSSRFGATDKAKVDAWTGQAFSDLYYVFMDRRGVWSTSPESFENDEKINSPVNEGEPCFSPDGNTIYFSRCDIRENQTQGCYIYTSTKHVTDPKAKKKKKKAKKGEEAVEDQDGWSTPTRIYLGDTAYNYLYPAVTEDGLTMYFSSDIPGGSGDYDIWMATRASLDASFGKPVNLGKRVNTAGREVFPYLRSDTSLYFSSNGLPGIGGQDLFKVTLNGKTVLTDPQNLGVPLNSSYDETTILFYPEGKSRMEERGYLSSNRPFDDPHNKELSNKGKKVENLNDDLFYFELPPLQFSIEGIVRDEKSMQLVENAKVKLIGSDGSDQEVYTDKKGFYRFDNTKVHHNVVYKIYVSKVDYFTVEGSESTKGYTTDKDIVHNVRIVPVTRQPIVLPEIRYDLSKWDLKEEFMDSLMDLYLIMVNNPGLVVEIRAHTDCRPFLGLTNDTLSQRRAQSVVDYLVSRGIERDRMVAKGYGEREPRTLTRSAMVRYNGKTYTFSEGTTMACDYINHLPDEDYKEAAHMLNRRIEFQVVRTDYISKRLVENMASETPTARQTEDGHVIDLVNKPVQEENVSAIIVHNEGIVPVAMIQSSKGEIEFVVNGCKSTMLVDERYNEPISMSWEEAMSFLYQRRIDKEDFPDRDNAFDPEGNILDKSVVILKEMQIGQQKLKNVEVIIVKGVNYKFIISRAGLTRFGEYEFDKQRGRIYFFND